MTKSITTHNGQFHADEVVAYTMLHVIYPDNKLIRTRDKNIIDTSDIVIDVGMVYDSNYDRFDHHQENCHEMFTTNNIPMSSAGMVYKKYGKQFIEKVINNKVADELYYEFYNNIIKEIDAIDNGIDISKNDIHTGISRMISRFNSPTVFDDKKQMEQFLKAAYYAETVLGIIAHDLYEKENMFNQEYCEMKKIIDKKEKNYIVVEFDCVNWYKCIEKYMSENKKQVELDWIIYKDDKNWRIRTVNKYSKKLKPEEYLKTNMSKPDELIFVHKGLFIASATTLDTIIEIANLSI